MPNTNDFKAWAIDPAADVLTQAAFIALIATLGNKGFISGTAISGQLNKVWRQSSFTSAFLNQWISDTLAVDTLDDADLAAAEVRFKKALLTLGGVEQSIAGNTNTNAASNRRAFVATVALTLTIAQTTTLDTTWQNSVYAFGGDVLITPNAADSINSLGVGIGYVVRKGSVGVVVTDGAGKLYVSSAPVPSTVTTLTGAAVLTSANAGLVLLDTTAAPFTVTLPAGAGLNDIEFKFVKISTDINAATIHPTGTDTFASIAGDLTLIAQFDALSIAGNGATPTKWYQQGLANKVPGAVNLITGQPTIVIAGKSQIYLGANVSYDGTNFNRQNIAQTAAAIEVDKAGNVKLLTAAAGANPIAWSTANVWTDKSVLSGTINDTWSGSLGRTTQYVFLPDGHGWISVLYVMDSIGWSVGTDYQLPGPNVPANPYTGVYDPNYAVSARLASTGQICPVLVRNNNEDAAGHIGVRIVLGSAPAGNILNILLTGVF